ncbi:alpha/beta fold hydrolase [Streptomyces althioticus]|uniref:alpha/beta fold hydrolase n=1 Tax=Streptomyces TaxID=1883 RepID=UPI0033FB1DF2
MTTHMKGTSRRGYLDLPHGQVHYREAGRSGAPALVVLHQSPLSSATYEPVMELLAGHGIQVVALDTPGFGMSDATPGQWSMSEYAASVWQAVDALGLGTVHLLGQHTGALIAAEAALSGRERVSGLIFQGIPLYTDEERAEKAETYAPSYTTDADGGHLKVIWDRIRGLYPTISADSASRQVAEYLSVGPRYGVAYPAVFRYQVDPAALAGIPTLLLHGTEDVLDRMNDVVTAAFPHAPLVTIPGGTDFVAEEQPEVFAAAVAEHVLAHAPALASPPPFTPVYTATADAAGGRGGTGRSRTGSLAGPDAAGGAQ